MSQLNSLFLSLTAVNIQCRAYLQSHTFSTLVWPPPCMWFVEVDFKGFNSPV